MLMHSPHLINFSKVGSPDLGYISVAQNSGLPFEIKRVYWTYFTPDSIIRGHHAHHQIEQIIIATSGRIEFSLEDINGHQQEFVLNSPNIGLYIPQLYWRTIKFSHNAVLMCLTSHEYDESEYIRDYDEFKRMSLTAR